MANYNQIIGRKAEIKILEEAYEKERSEFIALYGRRRIGKTFLVTQVFRDRFTFRMTGIANVSTKQQLRNFTTTFQTIVLDHNSDGTPEDWFEAFQWLIGWLEHLPHGRKVLFFDELPWLDTKGSDFLSALEHFWNSWASLRNDILLITCGSAASWMIHNLIRNRGGLHNRVTERIALNAFTLHETELFLKSRGAQYDRYQIVELYMTIGGIPFYLDAIQPNRSIAQNIDRLCFSKSGLLHGEYNALFTSLFKKSERHLKIIDVLAKKQSGLTRKELIKASHLPDGGALSNTLKELEYSGFIQHYIPFGKKSRGRIYRVSDPYSLFYQTFIKDSKAQGEGAWLSRIESPKWRSWSGIAFEYICLKHINQIKGSLGIRRVYTEISPWRSNKKEDGAQIDLLIDRNDRVINICEMKFSTSRYTITKAYAEKLRKKRLVFQEETETRKTLFLTLITTYGIKENEYARQLVNDEVTMDALFEF